MKKFISLLLALTLLLGLCACNTPATNDGNQTAATTTEAPQTSDSATEATTEPTDPAHQFSLGFQISLPADFTEWDTQVNDFLGTGDLGAYTLTANKEPKQSDNYADKYAEALANVLGAEDLQKNQQGNNYFTYQKDGSTQFYTIVLEGNTYIYHFTFYCSVDNWAHYQPLFAQWATTIEIE